MSTIKKILYPAVVLLSFVTAVLILSACSSNSSSQIDSAQFGLASARAAEPIGRVGASEAAAAIEKAGADGKYIFTLFYRTDDAQTEAARAAIQSARKKISRKSEMVEVNITLTAERPIVSKFRTARAPMPTVLVLAPNGANMGGFTSGRINEQNLVDAIGTRASEQALKALQAKNMVVLCSQNKQTSENSLAMSGVEELLQDPKYSKNTAVVYVDPADPAEAKFFSQMKLEAICDTATTALLAPPGSVVCTFTGATEKDQFVKAIKAAASGRCGPRGCGGKPCGPVKQVAPKQKVSSPATKNLKMTKATLSVKSVEKKKTAKGK
jgi:hypothetical protein